ncbi:MAG: LD-carboxypeptidase, partial [Clostridiales bacterium]|nr:LD-carboxypeptidase [Clostridiales bacterium]
MKLKKLPSKITVGVFSSSSPISATVPERYERGKNYLLSKGISVVDGALYGKSDFYRSGSIKERADEFNALLHNDEIDVIMASIGGNNTNSILPYIDYEYIKKHPKVIVGYSDTTALLLAVYAKTGVPVFYGPALASSFGEFPPFVDMTYNSFCDIVLFPKDVPYVYENPPFWTDERLDWKTQDREKTRCENALITAGEGKCRGRLIGGNLNTMEGFFGTPYMPKIKRGDVLLIEDSLKDACTIERSFSLLELAGVFDKVGGIILGKHELFDDNGTGRRPVDILLEVIGDRNIPILADFDCCHTHPMHTLPIGCEVILDAGEKRLTLVESP